MDLISSLDQLTQHESRRAEQRDAAILDAIRATQQKIDIAVRSDRRFSVRLKEPAG